jgi:hypothetical protein
MPWPENLGEFAKLSGRRLIPKPGNAYSATLEKPKGSEPKKGSVTRWGLAWEPYFWVSPNGYASKKVVDADRN